MLTPKHLFNLFFLFISIVWIPFQRYYLHVDGAGRTILFLSLIAVLLNLKELQKRKHVFRSPAFMCWGLLVLYSMLNSYFKGFYSEWGFWEFYKTNYISPFVFLSVMIIELDTHQRRTLRVLLFALMTFVLVGIFNLSGEEGERFGAEELGNLLPLNAVCAMLVSSLLYTKHRMPVLLFVILVSVLFTLIIISGTRKALGAAVILLIGVVLSRNKKLDVGTIVRTFIFAIILYMGLSYILENTLIGMRIAQSSEMSDVVFTENRRVNNFLLTVLGDRSIMYLEGWYIWKTHPITGIGIMNFMPVSGIPLRLHTEYMVQLCENGLIGFFLLIMTYYNLYKALLKRYSKMFYRFLMPLFTFLTLLFIDLTAWTYCTMFGMIFYSVLYSEAYSNSQIIRK